jgi:hypothetical protein
MLSVVNENAIEERELITVNVYKVTFLWKANVKDTFSKKERIHKGARYMSSATENIKRHITVLGFGFGNAFARRKDLIFLTCMAEPVILRGAKSRMCGTERLENPPVTVRYSRQHRCWGSSLYLFHISCKTVGLYAVKYSVSSAYGFGTWKVLRGWQRRGKEVLRVIETLKNFVSEEPATGLCCKFEGGSLCFQFILLLQDDQSRLPQ